MFALRSTRFALGLSLGLSLALAATACKRATPPADPPGGGAATGAATGTARTGAPGGEKIAVPGGEGGDKGGIGGGAARGGPDTSYAVAVSPVAGAAGAPVMAKVSVTPGAGYKMNKDDPTKLTVTPAGGVTAAAPVQKLDEHELTFEVPLTASAAGSYQVPAELKFAVCTATTCDPKKQQVAIDLTAK